MLSSMSLGGNFFHAYQSELKYHIHQAQALT